MATEYLPRENRLYEGLPVFQLRADRRLAAGISTRPRRRRNRHATHCRVRSFAANTARPVRHGGNPAYYSITNDYVQMPPSSASRPESYYATLFDELTHWTPARRRGLTANSGASAGRCWYAAEELVAG